MDSNVSIEEDVKNFLDKIGCVYTDDDYWLLKFCIGKITDTIKNECNVQSIPEGLQHIAVQMAVGDFLYNKKNSGMTDAFTNIDFTAAVKTIQEGDTNLTFAIGDGVLTPEQKLDNLISYLMSSGRGQFVTYRRLKW